MREAVDGLYELFLVKRPDLKLYQGIFNTFPNIQEWSMNDLYSRHPDPAKSFLYMYQGRKDDVIVLNNGEKIVPVLMEATLISDPLVKGAMVVGKGKFQPAVIIDLAAEPPKSTVQRHKLVERLLPVISEANVHAPAHGKLDQYHILFADPNKPLSYLGQGKIQRNRTYALYEEDIEEVYRVADDASEQFGFSKLPRLDFQVEESIDHWLGQLIAEITGIRKIDMDEDLFEAGVDSLQVIRMARELRLQAQRANLEQHGAAEWFPPSTIYKHPTLNQLKAFILRQSRITLPVNDTFSLQINGPTNGITNGIAPPNHMRNPTSMERMRKILQSHASSLPRSSKPSPPASTEHMTVLLSGSTGSLGSYLLEALYHNKRVSHIICLNRSPNAAERHKQTGPRRGLSPLDPRRVEFLQADLSKLRLGLSPTLFEYLRSTVTHVIRE